MVDVIARRPRAQRIDVRLGSTAYTPSANVFIDSGIDPATLNMEGLWRANFPGSPWPGTASNGGSGASPARDLEAGNVGGGGTPVNGWTPFNCNGASIYVVGHAGLTWGDLIGATNGDFYVHVIARWNTAAATIDPLSDPAILSDNGGSYGFSYSTSGVQWFIYDNAGTPQFRTVGPVSASTVDYHLVQVWWDSAAFTMWIQVDGGTAVSADLFSSDFGSANAVTVGANWDLSAFLDGDILEIAIAPDKFDATTRGKIRGYVQNRYALAMGYTGTTTFPNTQIHPTAYRPNYAPHWRNVDAYLYPDPNYVAPVIAPTYTRWAFDDVPVAHQNRPKVPAAHQQPVSVANVIPIIAAPVPSLVAIEAPAILARRGSVADRPAEARGPVAPERTSALATVVAPDRVERPTHQPARQHDATRPPPQPEQRGPVTDTDAPDMVRRPAMPATHQQAVTTIAPAPERKSPIAVTVAPERVLRPSLGVWLMPDVTRPAPAPERTAPVWSVDAPDRIVRPTYSTTTQQASTTLPPAPERQLPFSDAIAPERVGRAYPAAVWQQDRAFWPLPIINVTPAPNITPPVAPDRIQRPMTGPWWMVDVVTSPRPEAPLPQVSVSAPERVPRPVLDTARHPSVSAQPAKPERTSPLASVSYSDTVVRPSLRTVDQQAVTTHPAAPERTAPMAVVDAPVAVARPWLHVGLQQVVPGVGAYPERTGPLAAVVAQERAPRPVFEVRWQQPVTTLAPAPERSAPLAPVDAPTMVSRPAPRTADHQALAVTLQPPAAPPAPLGVPLETHPDTVSRPSLLAHLQQATPTFWPLPLPNSPAPTWSWAPSYADSVRRPTPLTAHHQDTALPPRPERTSPLGLAIAPYAVRRPLLAPPLQQASSVAPVRPERPAPLADIQAPERITRPTFAAALQLVSAGSSSVERSAPLAAVSASDIVLRPTFGVAQQQHTVAGPKPEQRLPLPSTVYPDRPTRPLPRPDLHVAPLLSPQPPAPVALSWQPVYADRAPPPLLRIMPEAVVWTAFLDFPLTSIAHLTSKVGAATAFLSVVVTATAFGASAAKASSAFASIVDRETWLVRFVHDLSPATTLQSQVSTMELHVGDTARVDTTIKVDGVATDPSSLSCEVQSPSGTKTTYTYPSANLVKLSTGNYRCLVDCTEAGTWKAIWSSPGPTAKGADYVYFDVTVQPFTP